MNVQHINNLTTYIPEHSLPGIRSHFAYALSQNGGSLDYFHPVRKQTGSGIGSILGNIFSRSVLLTLRSFGSKAVKSGLDVVMDILAGKNVKDSLKQRGIQAVANTVEELTKKKPNISRPKKRKRVILRKGTKRARTGLRDIFSQ